MSFNPFDLMGANAFSLEDLSISEIGSFAKNVGS